MKQSYRHLVLIFGTLFTVFGLLLFSYSFPFSEADVYAILILIIGLYMLTKMLVSAHTIKPKKVSIVSDLKEKEPKENKYKKKRN